MIYAVHSIPSSHSMALRSGRRRRGKVTPREEVGLSWSRITHLTNRDKRRAVRSTAPVVPQVAPPIAVDAAALAPSVAPILPPIAVDAAALAPSVAPILPPIAVDAAALAPSVALAPASSSSVVDLTRDEDGDEDDEAQYARCWSPVSPVFDYDSTDSEAHDQFGSTTSASASPCIPSARRSVAAAVQAFFECSRSFEQTRTTASVASSASSNPQQASEIDPEELRAICDAINAQSRRVNARMRAESENTH